MERIAVLLLVALAACSSSSSGGAPAAPPGDDGGVDGGAPILDPKLFDCARAKDPDRVATTPQGCAMDPTCTTRLVAAHRGAGGPFGKLAPEDTLAAYRAGIALGVDFVETDPRPTKDGKLVNIHDTTVDRTTDGKGTVSDMTFDQVRALHIKTTLPGDYSCEKVPTLEELLTVCKGKAVVLVDGNKTDRVDLLVAAIQATGTLEWAIFDTSDTAKIDAALVLEPKLRTMIRISSAAQATTVLDHFAGHPPVLVEIEGDTSDIKGTTAAVHARGNRALMDSFGQDASYGADSDPKYYQSLFDLGIDVVQSDRPDGVLRFLGRR